jgi:hypothetical protein
LRTDRDSAIGLLFPPSVVGAAVVGGQIGALLSGHFARGPREGGLLEGGKAALVVIGEFRARE